MWTAAYWKTFVAFLGTHHNYSIAYRPRGNGAAEMAVKKTVGMLRSVLVDHAGTCWYDWVPLAQFHLNDTVGPSGFTPFQLLYGRNPVGLGDEIPEPMSAVCVGAEEFMVQ